MYGNLITSNGVIQFEKEEMEKEIVLEKTVQYLNILIANHCDLYLNDSSDYISLFLVYTQPFEVRGMPIHKFTIKRNDQTFEPFEFSYYGFY